MEGKRWEQNKEWPEGQKQGLRKPTKEIVQKDTKTQERPTQKEKRDGARTGCMWREEADLGTPPQSSTDPLPLTLP